MIMNRELHPVRRDDCCLHGRAAKLAQLKHVDVQALVRAHDNTQKQRDFQRRAIVPAHVHTVGTNTDAA